MNLELTWHVTAMPKLDQYVFTKLMEREDCRHWQGVSEGTDWQDLLSSFGRGVDSSDIERLFRYLVGEKTHRPYEYKSCCLCVSIQGNDDDECDETDSPAQSVINELREMKWWQDYYDLKEREKRPQDFINSHIYHAVNNRLGMTTSTRAVLCRLIARDFSHSAARRVFELSLNEPELLKYNDYGQFTGPGLVRFKSERLRLVQAYEKEILSKPPAGIDDFKLLGYIDFDSLLLSPAFPTKSTISQPKLKSQKTSIKERHMNAECMDIFLGIPKIVLKNHRKLGLTEADILLIETISDISYHHPCSMKEILEAMGHKDTNRSRVHKRIRRFEGLGYVIITNISDSNKRSYDFSPLWAKFNEFIPKLTLVHNEQVMVIQ